MEWKITRPLWVGIMVAVGAAAAVAANSAQSAPPSAASVGYPAGYREWTHVKSTIVGPASASFKSNGGIHHYYANAQAMAGLRSGEFPDGATLIDDLLEARESGSGVTSEGARRRLAVMVKDSQKFASTGGWGFEVFREDATTPSLTEEGRASCFSCHRKRPESVFSEYRK